jgi:transaldolase
MTSGELDRLIGDGILGITSNPSIFNKAITGSDDYDESLNRFVEQGYSDQQIYQALTAEDIRKACEILLPVYQDSRGVDGYVSIEVSPKLAHDTEGTIDEARQLFALIDQPNVMIKVPATEAGIPAIRTLISDGINVNITLIFSIDNYEQVMEAYLGGLERYAESHDNLSGIASVASFFVSRVDTAVDRELEARGEVDLLGKIAIANTKLAYQRFLDTFQGERWQALVAKGARPQRPLWASTSTKNPAYPDTMYVDELIGPDTVNTMPPETVEAVLDHGRVHRTIDEDLETAESQIGRLASLGIDLNTVTGQLQVDGVDAFEASFDALMEGIRQKCGELSVGA